MTKGTQSFGKAHSKTHTICVRCGRKAFHKQTGVCAGCSFPSAKRHKYNWSVKAIRRKTTGSGRKRYLKTLPRKFKNHFREGTIPKARVVVASTKK